MRREDTCNNFDGRKQFKYSFDQTSFSSLSTCPSRLRCDFPFSVYRLTGSQLPRESKLELHCCPDDLNRSKARYGTVIFMPSKMHLRKRHDSLEPIPSCIPRRHCRWHARLPGGMSSQGELRGIRGAAFLTTLHSVADSYFGDITYASGCHYILAVCAGLDIPEPVRLNKAVVTNATRSGQGAEEV